MRFYRFILIIQLSLLSFLLRCSELGVGDYLENLQIELPHVCDSLLHPGVSSPDSMLGDGTEENPYAVCVPEHLKLIGNSGEKYRLDEHYWLEKNLNMEGRTFVPIGSFPNNCFGGSFNSLGYTISNYQLILQEVIDFEYNIFTCIAPEGRIINLNLSDFKICDTNIGDIDCDNDGVSNGIDAFSAEVCTSKDTDGDGFANETHATADVPSCIDPSAVMIDNCPEVSNPLQTNSDTDMLGDACDNDRDGDGIVNDMDSFPDTLCASTDTDGDGIADTILSPSNPSCRGMSEDNCPLTSNPLQTNSDTDMMGDACDVDDDNDGLIELTTLTDLHNVRFDLDGSHLDDESDDSAGNEGNNTGCPLSRVTGYACPAGVMEGCCGYELMNDLNFDADGDGRTWDAGSLNLDMEDSQSPYFIVDSVNSGGWMPIGDNMNRFTGIFEGNGNTIRNLAIRRYLTNIGLFGHIGGGATVRNLMVADSLADYIGNSDEEIFIGILAGRSVGGTIMSVHTSGRSDGGDGMIDYVGGLVGSIFRSSITNSHAMGMANGGDGDSDRVGGLVGGEWRSQHYHSQLCDG